MMRCSILAIFSSFTFLSASRVLILALSAWIVVFNLEAIGSRWFLSSGSNISANRSPTCCSSKAARNLVLKSSIIADCSLVLPVSWDINQGQGLNGPLHLTGHTAMLAVQCSQHKAKFIDKLWQEYQNLALSKLIPLDPECSQVAMHISNLVHPQKAANILGFMWRSCGACLVGGSHFSCHFLLK